MNGKLEIQKWPQIGGPKEISTAAGPRKKMPAAFNRSRWEKDITDADPGCRICKDEANTLSRHSNVDDEEWVVLDSISAPEIPHHLITPRSCQSWPKEQVRMLGGKSKIEAAIKVAQSASDLANVQFSLQIGVHAAQTVGHAPLYHLYTDNGKSQTTPDFIEAVKKATGSNALVFEHAGIEVRAGGHRTGECLFLPKESNLPPFFDEKFATTLHRLNTLFMIKFRSTGGLPPDISFEICIQNGRIQFGAWIPILNPIGTMEWMALFMPGRKSWNLMWPHHQTAEVLRG